MPVPTPHLDDRAARLRLGWRAWRTSRWLMLGLPVLAFLLGGAADSLVHGRRVDLLSLPFWGLVVWNLVVCLVAAASLLRGPGMGPAAAAGPASPSLSGLELTAPQRARGVAALHAAAAAFALGVVASAYLRALVVDLRAGWESTLLSPAAAQALLGVLLAPAQAVLGERLPDLTPLRLAAGAAASADAAPWLHRLALTLLLLVVLPRSVLALHAAWRARRSDPRAAAESAAPGWRQAQAPRPWGRVQAVAVWPCPLALAEPRRPALQAWLADAIVDTPAAPLTVHWLPALTPGDDGPPAAAPPDAALGLLLVDAAATPEAEVHGRLIAALRDAGAGLPLLLAIDAQPFAQRFGHLPQRLAERRRAWQTFAAQQGLQSIWLLPPA